MAEARTEKLFGLHATTDLLVLTLMLHVFRSLLTAKLAIAFLAHGAELW